MAAETPLPEGVDDVERFPSERTRGAARELAKEVACDWLKGEFPTTEGEWDEYMVEKWMTSILGIRDIQQLAGETGRMVRRLTDGELNAIELLCFISSLKG